MAQRARGAAHRRPRPRPPAGLLLVARAGPRRAALQHPRIPGFAAALGADVLQLHSSAYRRPSDLPGGRVLVVGAGNSGAQIAVELAEAGREVEIAFDHLPRRLPQRLLGRDVFDWLHWSMALHHRATGFGHDWSLIEIPEASRAGSRGTGVGCRRWPAWRSSGSRAFTARDPGCSATSARPQSTSPQRSSDQGGRVGREGYPW
ncbi:MAG: NAD(P)-binding domain-containing protein [Myxococcota bacterium]